MQVASVRKGKTRPILDLRTEWGSKLDFKSSLSVRCSGPMNQMGLVGPINGERPWPGRSSEGDGY